MRSVCTDFADKLYTQIAYPYAVGKTQQRQINMLLLLLSALFKECI